MEVKGSETQGRHRESECPRGPNSLNRRMRTRMYGGVQGRTGDRPSYADSGRVTLPRAVYLLSFGSCRRRGTVYISIRLLFLCGARANPIC
jgi:hypothetical protein